MIITHKSSAVRLTGRWDTTNDYALTTAPGTTIECAFTGKNAVLMFNTDDSVIPFPHLWISLDNGTKIETSIDRLLRVEAENDGNHVLKIIFKSAMEMQHRWYLPLQGKVVFCGVEADGEGILPPDNRKNIEFIGDSITEGVLIDEFRKGYPGQDQPNRVYQDDSTATYAYLTAMQLNMRPTIMGYGAVGITKSGCGSVPRVLESYPYCFDGSPFEPIDADITVINHGANDRSAPIEKYLSGYTELLDLVRRRNPTTKLVVLSPFCGFAAKELGEMVEKYNAERKESVTYINTETWIPGYPIHPLRDGHQIVADKLTEELKKLL